MVIFIDESGIHSTLGHSTTVIVYVEIEKLNRFNKDFTNILRKLNLMTFHWAEHGWKVRSSFLKKILKLDFIFKIAIFKNPVDVNKMYDIVFQQLITESNIRNIYIDGKKPKWYERKLKKILRDKGISVAKLKTVRKEISQSGLQLADGLAGLGRCVVDNPNAKEAWGLFNQLKKEKKLFIQYLF